MPKNNKKNSSPKEIELSERNVILIGLVIIVAFALIFYLSTQFLEKEENFGIGDTSEIFIQAKNGNISFSNIEKQGSQVSFNWNSEGLGNGSRTISNIENSRDVAGVYEINESIETNATNPWLSRAVFKELKEGKNATVWRLSVQNYSGLVAFIKYNGTLLKIGDGKFSIKINGISKQLSSILIQNDNMEVSEVWDNEDNPLILASYSKNETRSRIMEIKTK